MAQDEELYDFSDQVFPGNQANRNKETTDNIFEDDSNPLSMKDQIETSYVLVNMLVNLLIAKGVIKQQEVNSLVSELSKEYKIQRGE